MHGERIKKVLYGGRLKQVYGGQVYGKSIKEVYGRRLKKVHCGRIKNIYGGSRLLLCQDKIQGVFHRAALSAATGKRRHRAAQESRLHSKLWKKSTNQLPLTTAPLALATRTWCRQLGPKSKKDG